MDVARMRSDLFGFIEVEIFVWVERGESGCFVVFLRVVVEREFRVGENR